MLTPLSVTRRLCSWNQNTQDNKTSLTNIKQDGSYCCELEQQKTVTTVKWVFYLLGNKVSIAITITPTSHIPFQGQWDNVLKVHIQRNLSFKTTLEAKKQWSQDRGGVCREVFHKQWSNTRSGLSSWWSFTRGSTVFTDTKFCSKKLLCAPPPPHSLWSDLHITF